MMYLSLLISSYFIHSYPGSEFKNRLFKKLMKNHGINHYFSFSPIKCSFVERVIRTLKNKIAKFQTLHGTFRYINDLDAIVDEYNETKHSKTKRTPNSITKNDENYLLKNVYKYDNCPLRINKKPKFKVGDYVRINRIKRMFEKNHTHSWSTEIFKVYIVKLTNPITYILQDYKNNVIEGAFYTQVTFSYKFFIQVFFFCFLIFKIFYKIIFLNFFLQFFFTK